MARDESKALSGIAILLMIALHVLAGSMYTDKSIIFPDEMITFGATFGKVCVSIFAFISGYGLTYSYKQAQKEFDIRNVGSFAIKRLGKFFILFWPICILASVQQYLQDDAFDFIELIKNMIGLSHSYNAAWWYVIYYEVMVLILFPFILFCIWIFRKKLKNGEKGKYFTATVILLSFVSMVLDRRGKTGTLCLLVFISGAAFEEYIDDYGNIFCTPVFSNRLTTILLAWSAFLLRIYTTGAGRMAVDCLCMPLMVPGILLLLRYIKWLKHFLVFIGKHSTIMWLVHSLLYKYNDVFYCFPDGVTAYVAIVFLSLFISIAYMKILDVILKKGKLYGFKAVDKVE